MNNCTFAGPLGKDWEIRYSQDGKAIGKCSMALKDRDRTTWINLTAFGKTAETLEKYTGKGAKLVVSARYDEGKYEKDGKTNYFPQFIISGFTFMDSKQQPANQAPAQGGYQPPNGGFTQNEGDIPF